MDVTQRAVVLTATVVEYTAVLDLLDRKQSLNSVSGAPYTVGYLHAPQGMWEVWAACIGQGNVNAALQASQAIQELQPEVIAFLGTAGGLKAGVRLGDVVFATKVYGYEAGKATDERLLARPDVGLADPQLMGFARRIAASDRWQRPRVVADSLAAPRVHVEAIVAGEKIQSGQREELREHLRVSFNDAVAVEMEGLGFLTAAHQMGGIKAMVIRGISDLLSDKSPEQDERVQPVACGNAARFLSEMLRDCWTDPALFRRRRRETVASRGRADPMTFLPADASVAMAILSRSDIPALDLAGVAVGAGYRLVREIGRGSLNAVWEAEERAFDRTLSRVAIKLQPPDSSKRFRYFSREASTMAAFDSPYMIPYRAAGTMRTGELEGWSYIATGLADGSLRDWINERPLEGENLVSLLLDIARALEYLHDRRLVHGDIKPANILWFQKRWVLGDFGLTQPSGSHEPEGTLGYMAPERFAGKVVTGNDVYSFAVTAVAAACRAWRDESRTVDSTIGRVAAYLASNVPVRPDYDPSAFPEEFREVLHSCFDEEPAERPAMRDVVAQLEHARTW